jgi:predicted SAM-dependent methyltransferase
MRDEEIKNFIDDGFVKINPEKSFCEYLDTLSQTIQAITPDYESKKIPKINHSIFGIAISQRLDEGILPSEIKHSNPLYGKRLNIQAHDFPKPLVSLIEHPYILDKASALLGTDDIVFHNGAISASYPGNTGNDGKYHSDTSNFTNKKETLGCVAKNKFLVNIMVLLDDVSDSLAPMSVIKGTHKKESHFKLNSLVSERLKLSDNVDNLTQDNWVYNELIEDVVDLHADTVLVTGDYGTISLMNSSTLHKATENFTSKKVRRVAILNYGRRQDTNFHRTYPLSRSKTFMTNLKNKELGRLSYLKSAGVISHLKSRVVKYISILRKAINRQVNRIKHPEYVFFKASRAFEKLVNKFKNINREYINIGAGPVFFHERFFTFDINIINNKSQGRINFDFSKGIPFPFEDNSIKGVYTSHCLEHLSERQVSNILKESYRILKPGGVIRITLPDMDKMFDAYEARDASYLTCFKEKMRVRDGVWAYDSWLRLVTRSFAGHVVDLFSDKELYGLYHELKEDRKEFVGRVLDEAENSPKYRNVPNAHKSYWSPEIMLALLNELRFKDVNEVEQRWTIDPVFSNGAVFNNTQAQASFFVEATK